MSAIDAEINAHLDHHWHVFHDGTIKITYELCSDPCVRSDQSVLILPNVGAVGVEIRHRLRFPGGGTAAQLREENQRAWHQGYIAGEHMRTIARLNDD